MKFNVGFVSYEWHPASAKFFRQADGSYQRPEFAHMWLRLIASRIEEPFYKGVFVGPYLLACSILQLFFGEAWCRKYVLVTSRENFFTRNAARTRELTTHVLRVQEIAEHLINLINRPGVEGPIAQIGSGQIEPGFAELQAAKLLELHSVDFNFRLASGVKGQDYDLRVRAVNGANVCVDTKCKLETNSFFESGFYNSLKNAKKRNVPPNLPCGIMVKSLSNGRLTLLPWIQLRGSVTASLIGMGSSSALSGSPRYSKRKTTKCFVALYMVRDFGAKLSHLT